MKHIVLKKMQEKREKTKRLQAVKNTSQTQSFQFIVKISAGLLLSTECQAKLLGVNKMNTEQAKKILHYVVEKTKPRWKQYDEDQNKINEVFIRRGYEQGGFEAWKFAELLKNQDIFSIEKIGLILDKYKGNTKYDCTFAGSLKDSFYKNMANGVYGKEEM